MPIFCKIKLNLMAVINGAKRGACRNRRYATRSIAKLMLALKTDDATNARTATPTRRGHAEDGVTPEIPTIVIARIAPIMKTSPCAKLMISTMPYTIVYPRAMRAISDPLAMPITTACISRFQFTSIVRGLRASTFRERPADAEARALAHPCRQHHLSEERLSDRLQINDLP